MWNDEAIHFITHATITAGMGRSFSRVCLSVCLRSDRKTAWAIPTKLGTRILYSSSSACIDPELKRSEVTELRKLSRLHSCWWPCSVTVRRCATFTKLPMFSSCICVVQDTRGWRRSRTRIILQSAGSFRHDSTPACSVVSSSWTGSTGLSVELSLHSRLTSSPISQHSRAAGANFEFWVCRCVNISHVWSDVPCVADKQRAKCM